jgi:site-specific DNA recombinase
MGKAVPAIPEFRARGHAQRQPGSAPVGVAFLGRTSTGTLQDPVESLARQYRLASERLPAGFAIVRCYWDVESGGIDLDARSQGDLWRQFAGAGVPRDGGMAELRAAVSSGRREFAAVICEDINRAGRDMLDSLRLEKELRAAGVMIFATSEPIDVQAPAASTMLVRRVRMAESEYFRYNLKTLMWEGLQQYAIGGHNTGKCPYGYAEDRTPHPNPMKASMGATRARLVPDPIRAPWVTRMFEWRAWEKLSVAGIARRLTDLGAPAPGPSGWNSGTVYNILRNPKYTGRIVLGRTTNGGTGRRKGEKKVVRLPREYWTWAAEDNAHPALTDMETWEKAQTVGRERGNSMDPGTRHLGRGDVRLYPFRSRLHCDQCHRRMYGSAHRTRRPGERVIYYVCPTHMYKPEDKAKWPGHVRASVREDVFTATLGEFLDTYALGYDRAARLAELIPASQAQQDDLDHARAQALERTLKKAEAAITGIAAEIAHLAGKTDPVSTAIRDRLTAQFSQRYDEKTALEAELAAIEDAAPLPASDLSLIDELPYAPGLLAHAPDDLRERLAAAFGLQAVYRQATRQATIVLTITDTTPGIIAAILHDPRIDSDTAATQAQPGNPPTSPDTSVDVSRTSMAEVMTHNPADGARPGQVGLVGWAGGDGELRGQTFSGGVASPSATGSCRAPS